MHFCFDTSLLTHSMFAYFIDIIKALWEIFLHLYRSYVLNVPVSFTCIALQYHNDND